MEQTPCSSRAHPAPAAPPEPADDDSVQPEFLRAVYRQLQENQREANSSTPQVKVGPGAPVYLAGVLQFLMKTMLKDASQSAAQGEDCKKVIIPKDIQQALKKHLTVMKTHSGNQSAVEGGAEAEAAPDVEIAYFGELLLSAGRAGEAKEPSSHGSKEQEAGGSRKRARSPEPSGPLTTLLPPPGGDPDQA